MDKMYKKLKKLKGERFARTLRDHHNGLLEIPEIDRIVRHAGREDAEELLPYLMSMLAANDNAQPELEPEDPFVLLDRAGYDAFIADTLDKQNSIKGYFKPGELLCTFNDASRYERYYIVHAVKKDVDQIRREDFKGQEARKDAYGTSVISIQMAKRGGFISIKNRYNHTVPGCDNTFGSNPDNIIPGLSAALKAHFDVDFSERASTLPLDYTPAGDRLFKYHWEENNIYYGDQAWMKDGKIHEIERGRYALFGQFVFDNKTKTLETIDPALEDNFAEDFNRVYSGRKDLRVDKGGNLLLGDDILIGAENSRITSLYLPGMTTLSDRSLKFVPHLKHLDAPDLETIGNQCFFRANSLTHLNMPSLTAMGVQCFRSTRGLTDLDMPSLTAMGDWCFLSPKSLTHLDMPSLRAMGKKCFFFVESLTHLDMPLLTAMGDQCFKYAPSDIKIQVRKVIHQNQNRGSAPAFATPEHRP